MHHCPGSDARLLGTHLIRSNWTKAEIDGLVGVGIGVIPTGRRIALPARDMRRIYRGLGYSAGRFFAVSMAALVAAVYSRRFVDEP
jgi:hypothetical protein